MKATAKDLRFHTKELLDTVGRGEEVIITHRGKPCAKLVPIEKPKKGKESGADVFGLWKDHEETADVAAYLDNLRKGRF